MEISPIFLVGAQRSGANLLRLIMNAHSQIAIPEEATFLLPLLNKKNVKKEISGCSLKRLVYYLALNSHFKLWTCDYSYFLEQLSQKEKISLKQLMDEIYTLYCRNEGKPFWGDTTASFFRKIDILHALFPQAKFIHIVRDGRAVFDSRRKMDPIKNYAAAMALEWSYKLFRIEKSLKQIPVGNKLTIRYEDLLEFPAKTVRIICAFFKVKYEPGMLEFYETSHNYIGNHHLRLISKIEKSNLYKWRENLTAEEFASFNLMAKYYLNKYNYSLGKPKNRLDVSYLLRTLTTGLVGRAIQILRVKNTLDIALKKGIAVNLDFIPIGEVTKERRG